MLKQGSSGICTPAQFAGTQRCQQLCCRSFPNSLHLSFTALAVQHFAARLRTRSPCASTGSTSRQPVLGALLEAVAALNPLRCASQVTCSPGFSYRSLRNLLPGLLKLLWSHFVRCLDCSGRLHSSQLAVQVARIVLFSDCCPHQLPAQALPSPQRGARILLPSAQPSQSAWIAGVGCNCGMCKPTSSACP